MTSPYRQILVHLDSTRGSRRRLEIACDLAAAHGATLATLYGALPRTSSIPFAPDISAAAITDLFEIEEERISLARRTFDETMKRGAGFPASWGEAVFPGVADAFAQQALFADLLVLGQPDPEDALAKTVPPDFVTSVLAQSGRAGLVIPYIGWDAPIGQVIAIAWKPTREAARAVAAAMPLLERARAVHVLNWSEESSDVIEGTALTLDSWLGLHGVQVTWSRGGPEPGDVGELMLSRSYDVGADLLVMGCYGHSRAREWALGGASRTLLKSMSLPLLMAH